MSQNQFFCLIFWSDCSLLGCTIVHTLMFQRSMLLSAEGPEKDEETGYKDDGHSGPWDGGHELESTGHPNSPSSDGWQLECKNNIVTGQKLICPTTGCRNIPSVLPIFWTCCRCTHNISCMVLSRDKSDYRWGLYWWPDLFTTYTHNS
jgi:hypothetical protein